LAADGFRVYEIKTRVQPAVTSYPGDGSPIPSSHPGPGLPWPRSGQSAAAAVAALAESVKESPLKGAAQKLAATLKGRAGAPKERWKT
jgi:hypothetical protein